MAQTRTDKVTWDEDQWIAACAHLIGCDSEDCRFCDRIKLQIKREREAGDGRDNKAE